MVCINSRSSRVWFLYLLPLWLIKRKREAAERARGKISLPVVNWAYRFLMCQAVASQMRDGTFFLPRIFLCLLFKANEVGLPVATWAGRSDTRDAVASPRSPRLRLRHPTRPPTLVPQTDGQHAHVLYERMHSRTHTHLWYTPRPMFAPYSLSETADCLFLLSQHSKHPLAKDFFFDSCLSFSPTCL